VEITDIRLKKVEGDDKKLKAWVSVTFDDCFVVHNMKVIEGQSGIFVAMPSRMTRSGEFKDVAHPITPDFRKILEDRILKVYQEEGDSQAGPEDPGKMPADEPLEEKEKSSWF